MSAIGMAVGLPMRASPEKMRLPRPGPFAYAAMARMPMAICELTRMPDSTDGHASRISTRHNVCIRDMPVPRAASTRAGSTAVSPTIVFRMIGSSE